VENGVSRGVGFRQVCLASWNIGSLTSKSIELVKSLHRCRISIAYVQETKWVGTKLEKLMGISCGIRGQARLQMEWVFWLLRSWFTLLLK